jgi:hypothetical protein
MTPNQKSDIELLKTQARIEIQRLEQANSAREVSSKYIGKTAVPWIVLLVIVGVVSAAFMDAASLPAVIGLVSTAVMALITMLATITGTKEKEERPEFTVIRELIDRLDEANESMNVTVEKDRVTVNKGRKTITSQRPSPD